MIYSIKEKFVRYSEDFHRIELNHFRTRKNRRIKMSKGERKRLKKAMQKRLNMPNE